MRCYFNLVHTHQILVDHEGVEADDLDEARTLTREAAAEVIQNGDADVTDWRGWRLDVVDGTGSVLFTLSLAECAAQSQPDQALRQSVSAGRSR
jgi:hypothetical protein